jgi:CDP-glucose 4,6-dehydratase
VEGLVNRIGDSLRGKRVFLTGHTGFKGSWMTLWLHHLGARVTGYSLEAAADSMFRRLELDTICTTVVGDVRDRAALERALHAASPDVVVHMAAQSLVLPSYADPIATIETNITGTANVLEALRSAGRSCTALVVTSDKCYENRGWIYGYRENDPLGGHDVYSMSKAAAELVTASYRASFFSGNAPVRLASGRAGNVIGGGDRAADRIVPDSIRALVRGEAVPVRNPRHTRPWQHVLDPLSGYLLLIEAMERGHADACSAWNFGPETEAARSVADLADAVIASWGEGTWVDASRGSAPHEAHTLRLSTDKARTLLGWRPRWSFETSVRKTVEWYRAEHRGASAPELRDLTLAQIDQYEQEQA